MNKLDDQKPVEIADGIWWVGFADNEVGFSNNPYLIVDGDEAVLVDPGPGHPIFIDIILGKIREVVNPDRIRYIVTHHPDPDICGLIPFIQNLLNPSVTILANPRTALFLPYYGITKPVLPIGDEDMFRMKSGRTLKFLHLPYVHFAGNMATFDQKTNSLFSSDLFGFFDKDWSLFVGRERLDAARKFIEHYVGERESLRYAYKKLSDLKIDRILPQHGGVIDRDIEAFLKLLKTTKPGRLIRALRSKPSPKQEQKLLDGGSAWLSKWSGEKVEADGFEDLMKRALKSGATGVALLLEHLDEMSGGIGVANPISFGRLHTWDEINSISNKTIFSFIRSKFLNSQYGVKFGDRSFSEALGQELLSAKAKLAVMFIDIRGFTNWCETRNRHEIVSTLNRQHSIMARVLMDGGGRINKMMGDGILAYFREGSLGDAVNAALKIDLAIKENGLLPVGIGMDFGDVILGDIGDNSRLDFTLIGRAVNHASRMCSAAGRGELVLTDRLYDALEDEVRKTVLSAYDLERIRTRYKPSDPEIPGRRLGVLTFR